MALPINHRSASVAVVGGGMTGISAAVKLARHPGIEVTLIEKRDRLGGLSDHFTWRDLSWDRFYHVVLSTDRILIDFLRELGLDGELSFTETRSGFFGDGKLVSMSSTGDFIRFPFLSLWQKFRLASGILYAAALKNPSRLDRIYVRQWLTSVFGRRVYEQIWDPLLRSKLGSAREQTSAAFIWATITRLYGARDGETKKEQMGHVRGGYKRIMEVAQTHLRTLGVSLQLGQEVESVVEHADGLEIRTAGAEQNDRMVFDRVLLTVPAPAIVRIVGAELDETALSEYRDVKYLGVVCLVLVVSRSLSPYYVINLLDRSLPFTGVIEATNVVSPEDLGGRHLVYLPKYVVADDPLWETSDVEVRREFVAGLQRVFPDLRDSDVLHTRVFRERYVQPLQEIGALQLRKDHRLPLRGGYVANSAMMKNTTLNNNAAISLGRAAAQTICEDLRQVSDRQQAAARV